MGEGWEDVAAKREASQAALAGLAAAQRARAEEALAGLAPVRGAEGAGAEGAAGPGGVVRAAFEEGKHPRGQGGKFARIAVGQYPSNFFAVPHDKPFKVGAGGMVSTSHGDFFVGPAKSGVYYVHDASGEPVGQGISRGQGVGSDRMLGRRNPRPVSWDGKESIEAAVEGMLRRAARVLYRGVSEQEAQRLEAGGTMEPTPHPGNQLTEDVETAQFYAGQGDDPGVVVRLEVPAHAVKEDELYNGDHRVVSPFKPLKVERVKGGGLDWSNVRLVRASDFREEQHPRGLGGKFTESQVDAMTPEKKAALYEQRPEVQEALRWFRDGLKDPILGPQLRRGGSFAGYKRLVMEKFGVPEQMTMQWNVPPEYHYAMWRLGAHWTRRATAQQFAPHIKKVLTGSIQASDFSEQQHPRGPGGKWTRSLLNAEVERQLKERGYFAMDVPRATKYGGQRKVRFTVQHLHDDPAKELVHSIDALEKEGVPDWDFTVNQNFDNRERFLTRMLNYLNRAKGSVQSSLPPNSSLCEVFASEDGQPDLARSLRVERLARAVEGLAVRAGQFEESKHPRSRGRFIHKFSYSGPLLDPVKVFEASDYQRGAPESAMLHAQGKLHNNWLKWAVEHVGDLSHRAGEFLGGGATNYGSDGWHEKVRRFHKALFHDPAHNWSWEREVAHGRKANAAYAIEQQNQRYLDLDEAASKAFRSDAPEEEQMKAIEARNALAQAIFNSEETRQLDEQWAKEDAETLREYAAAHEAHGTLTKAQEHGRQAAIALGHQDWASLRKHILALKEMADEHDKHGDDRMFLIPKSGIVQSSERELRDTVRGTAEPHKLLQDGATPSPATTFDESEVVQAASKAPEPMSDRDRLLAEHSIARDAARHQYQKRVNRVVAGLESSVVADLKRKQEDEAKRKKRRDEELEAAALLLLLAGVEAYRSLYGSLGRISGVPTPPQPPTPPIGPPAAIPTPSGGAGAVPGVPATVRTGAGIAEPGAAEAADAYAASRAPLLTNFPQEVLDRLDREVELGRSLGETDEQLARRLAVKAEEIEQGSGAVLAQTETQAAYGSSVLRVLQRAGFETVFWDQMDRPTKRESHAENMALGEVPLGTMFPSGQQYPGDPRGGPGECINCLCILYGVKRKPGTGHLQASEAVKPTVKARDADDTSDHAHAVLFHRDGKHLTVLMTHDCLDLHEWSLPGGHVKQGETPLQSLVREIAEETGLTLKAKLLEPCGAGVYCCELDGAGELKAEHPTGELHWLPVDKLPDNKLVSDEVRQAANRLYGEESKDARRVAVEKRGLLIAFEGIDGAGKSTQIETLRKRLEKDGHNVVATRWKTSPVLGNAIAEAKKTRTLSPTVFSLLHAADLRWRVENVARPVLAEDGIVLADRYTPTSYVRDQLRGVKPDLLEEAYKGLPEPDLVIWLTVPTRTAVERIMADKKPHYYSSGLDMGYGADKEKSLTRYEAEMEKWYSKLSAEGKGWVEIKGDRPVKDVAADVWEAVKASFKKCDVVKAGEIPTNPLGKFSPGLHPHAPPGMPTGGQFVPTLHVHPKAPDEAHRFAAKRKMVKIVRVGDQPKEVKRGGKTVTRMLGGKWQLASGGDLPEHLAKVAIPPAWKSAHISLDPTADYLAVGIDEAERLQKLQSPEMIGRQAALKFARNKELMDKASHIISENNKNCASAEPKTREAANCLKLIIETGIRPGSVDDMGAAVQAYGATTLKGEHVVVGEGGKMWLAFVGKKGVKQLIPISRPDVREMLLERKMKAGASGNLFDTDDVKLRDYTATLDGGYFKPKDFRTLKGTLVAIREIGKVSPKPADMKAFKKVVNQIADTVASTLGNTREVALQSYINPFVWSELKPDEPPAPASTT